MNRKLSMGLLGIVCVMFLVGMSLPASATFTQDTLVINGTADTSSLIDTTYIGKSPSDTPNGLLDMAMDDSGSMYLLHMQREAGSLGYLVVTKVDTSGAFVKNLLVGSFSNLSGNKVRRQAIAVNRKTQAIYVVAANESSAVLFTDTGAQLNDSFTVDTIPGFTLRRMDTNFGSIDVTVFGGSATDSVYVVGIMDTPAGTTATKVDSGIKLWRFSSLGRLQDSALLVYQTPDTSVVSTGSSGETGPSLDPFRIPSRVVIQAIASDKIAVLYIGHRPFWNGDSNLTNDLGALNAADTTTGIWYDTFQILGSGAVTSDTGVDTIAFPAGSVGTDSQMAITMAWDTFNNRLVIYYQTVAKGTAKLRRAYIDGAGHYSASNDSDVSSELSTDTVPVALALTIQKLQGSSVKEHVAFRSRGSQRIYYINRAADALGTNVTFDTVALPAVGTAATTSDSNVTVGVTKDGSPRVFYAQQTVGEIFVNEGRPEAVALASDAGISVSNSQSLSSTTAATTPSITLNIVPPVNDDATPQFEQVAITQPSSSNPASASSLSDFTTPTYSVTAPLGNITGDTLTCDINSLQDGVALYIRRPLDTTPSGGSNYYDTYMFGGLTDSQITVLAGTMVKLRIGDTAGKMFTDNLISDSGVAVRVKMVLTPAYMATLVAAGIDTSHLSIWKATGSSLSTTNDFAEVGVSFTASDLHDGGNFTLTSSAITSFSFVVVAPGSPAVTPGGGGICLIGRFMTETSPTLDAFRSVRDALLSTRLGRSLTKWYYNLK